ncbi:MAG: hypothetical protein LBK26_02185 [Rickettsiales bacterium]|jgi:hypothetical protein|nr:hypothetical protein [Rickettsiales bacterium]
MSTENQKVKYFYFEKNTPKPEYLQPVQQITKVQFKVIDEAGKCTFRLCPDQVECKDCDGFGTGCGKYDPNTKTLDCPVTEQFITSVMPGMLASAAADQNAENIIANTTHLVKDSILYVNSTVKMH